MSEHGTITTLIFLPADGEGSWSLLSNSVTTIKVTTNVHLPKPVSSDLTINKVRFSFNQPNGKRWGTKLVDVVKHLQ